MECFLCTILPWPVNYAPDGFCYCDGTTRAIQQYQAVNALIGNLYGGDSRSNTFGIPNLKGRVPMGQDFTLQFQLAQTYGGNTVTLTAANIAGHIHPATFSPTFGPQQITIPGVQGSGAITATATTSVVPGQANAIDPVNGDTYYLTGVSNPSNGPFTKLNTPGPGNSATLIGTTVNVDASKYSPSIPQSSPMVNMVKGGSVQVGPNINAPSSFSVMQSSLALNFIFALNGVWPQRQ